MYNLSIHIAGDGILDHHCFMNNCCNWLEFSCRCTLKYFLIDPNVKKTWVNKGSKGLSHVIKMQQKSTLLSPSSVVSFRAFQNILTSYQLETTPYLFLLSKTSLLFCT
jgi:hypothetical protein